MSDKCNMSVNELKLLHKYLDKSQTYLEFGSGDSTLYACSLPLLNSICSVESSKKFIQEYLLVNSDIKKSLNKGKLLFDLVDIGETGVWGHPVSDEFKHLWPHYSSGVFSRKRDFS